MASDEIDFIDLKQTLRELADKGVSFELFKYRVNFKNIQVCGADYRYHKRVHDMPSPYPKQWDKTKVFFCEFVYYTFYVNDHAFFVAKPIDEEGLYFLDKDNSERADKELMQHFYYLERFCQLNATDVKTDVRANRLHLIIRGDRTYGKTTALIDRKLLHVIIGNFNGGRSLKKEIPEFLSLFSLPQDSYAAIKASFSKGKERLTKIISDPIALSNANWIEGYKNGYLWTVIIPNGLNLY